MAKEKKVKPLRAKPLKLGERYVCPHCKADLPVKNDCPSCRTEIDWTKV
jgi:hypothetical protein